MPTPFHTQDGKEAVILSDDELMAKVREYLDDAEALGLNTKESMKYAHDKVAEWIQGIDPAVPFSQ